MEHPIRIYLQDTGETQAAFAEQAGISKQLLSDVLNGRSDFSCDSLRRIHTASGERIDLQEIVLWEHCGMRRL